MREHQSVIGQSVGHHIILAVDVVHRPMNPALSKGVTEGDAGSKVRPQVGRAASSLPAAKYDNLARDNLGVQFEDDPLINVCHAKRPLHAALETDVFSHVTGMLGVESTVVRSARRARPRHANLPKSSSPKRSLLPLRSEKQELSLDESFPSLLDSIIPSLFIKDNFVFTTYL